MKKLLLTFIAVAATALFAQAANYNLQSPNKSITAKVSVGKEITWSIQAGNDLILSPSVISMTLTGGEVLGADAKVVRAKRNSVKEKIDAPLYKQASFTAEYNELVLTMRGDWGIEFRAYNDGGVAYRFFTARKEGFTVEDENVEFNFDKDYNAWYPYSNNSNYLIMSFENYYQYSPISGYDDTKMGFIPVLVDLGEKGKAFITESDLESYPGMYIHADKAKNGFAAVFPKYPAGDYTYSDRHERVGKRENYIAKVKGTRTFPWRIVSHVREDRQLPVNNMVYQTASPCRIKDTSWISGGKSAWDWWNDWGITGVDFKAGVNTATYKYYVDFAAANGLDYIILDEGWSSMKIGDIMTTIPEIDLDEILAYAKPRGVKVILWTPTYVLLKKLDEACKKYSEMGVAGFKVDFFDRQDQLAVEQAYLIAETTAKYGLEVNLHGIYKPTGLSRTFPNVVNYEGVWGLEQLKWTGPNEANMPLYDVTVPFIRMAAGPMDYTQGAMTNANRGNYRASYYEPMSQGTRAHQVATYVVFDSPMVMLCDAPSEYLKERETLDYIAAIPAVFDRMEILQGKVGEFIVTAREKDGVWYIGGLTNWTRREVTVDFSFLGDGRYKAEIFRDGVNANHRATDYAIDAVEVDRNSKINIQMASGGGFAIRLNNL